MRDFYRVAAATPQIKLADCEANAEAIIELYEAAARENAAVVIFPQLAVTGASCGSLFAQRQLQEAAEAATEKIARATSGKTTLAIFGAPLSLRGKTYDAALVAGNGEIRGAVVNPRPTSPLYSGADFGSDYAEGESGRWVIGEKVLFDDGNAFRFGITFGGDPRLEAGAESELVKAGAKLWINLDAAPTVAGSAARKRQSLLDRAAARQVAVAAIGAAAGESDSDQIYAPLALLSDDGDDCRSQAAPGIVYLDMDLGKFPTPGEIDAAETTVIELDPVPESPDLAWAILREMPYLPADAEKRAEVAAEIFGLQVAGLAQRARQVRAKALVLGVSGGLDSTLALLVAHQAAKQLGGDCQVVALTLPGFGTSGRTHNNALTLGAELGIAVTEIDIKPATLQHFADIGHDPQKFDSTYENAQARERTQILMDIANARQGLVIGTGDLSEGALGWCTFNGDHMSMYAVNASIPKSVIPEILRSRKAFYSPAAQRVLEDVIATPVSPELLPPSDGEIAQKTEELVGAYILHDFFLYYLRRYGAPVEKIRGLAQQVFAEKFAAAEIDRVLKIFFRRFFTQQFKRNCVPDGPDCLGWGLSPRTAWQMPAEASPEIWLRALDK